MPKSIEIDPSEIRKATTLKTADIKVHAYSRPLADERALRGDETLKRVLRHMLIIREFETGIASLKAQGSYGPVTYNYKGPAHLSIGQEAAAVGAALALKRTDHIYGSHRSHGEFLAKGLAAIDALDDDALEEIMERHQSGALLQKVTQHYRPASTKEAAEAFLLSGFLAEMFTRDDGFNGGMGGSMHAFFLPFGAYPNNAIVGASAGIAVGAALQMRLENRDDIAVSMIGDGATGCGPVWEAMNFAGMAQFETLWEKTGGLPVLFFFTNNFYAMGGQTKGETMAWDRLSRIGAGLRPDAYHGETVDGTDPLAVADAVAAKRFLILEGNGPAILDVECYRFSGHSTTDVNAYRTKDEIAAWQTVDPISSYRGRLAEADILGTDASQTMAEDVEALLHRVYETVADPSKFPPVNVHTEPTLIGQKMFSNAETPPSNSPSAPLKDPSTTIRVRQNAKKARIGVDEDGKLYSPMKAINLRDGLFEAILHHMLEDPRITAFGEECREWGGAFGVYRGLSDIFPHERVFNSPISEAAIVATAVGAAMEGGRPIIELMYADFLGRAGDEVFNQLAKWQAMSNHHLSVPVVLRCSVGSKYGAQHSQDWSALAAHIPGLKIVYPAT
ncbi:MAG: thiamine pyrophosphate-dependent enzyme, partial [Pseudomonadota bacterium]